MKGIKFFTLFLFLSCANKPVDKTTVAGTLDAHSESFRQCFLESDSYMGRHAQDAGKIDVVFMIDPKGRVQEEKIAETTFKDANLHACMLGQLKRIKFPKRSEAVALKMPLNFYRRQ
jgi:hypothetical protein